jgi:hypothetical protein
VNGVSDKLKIKSLEQTLLVKQVGTGMIRIDFELTTKQTVTVEMFDIRGVKIYSSGSLKVEPGRHLVYVSENTGRMTAGFYVIRLSGTVDRMVQKFVMIR